MLGFWVGTGWKSLPVPMFVCALFPVRAVLVDLVLDDLAEMSRGEILVAHAVSVVKVTEEYLLFVMVPETMLPIILESLERPLTDLVTPLDSAAGLAEPSLVLGAIWLVDGVALPALAVNITVHGNSIAGAGRLSDSKGRRDDLYEPECLCHVQFCRTDDRLTVRL